MDSTFWLNLGISGAVVFVVNLFLRHLRQEQCDRRVERQAFVDIIANHIDHEREAIEKLAEAIHSLETMLGECVKRPERTEALRRQT
jgi:hypothetical protein